MASTSRSALPGSRGVWARQLPRTAMATEMATKDDADTPPTEIIRRTPAAIVEPAAVAFLLERHHRSLARILKLVRAVRNTMLAVRSTWDPILLEAAGRHIDKLGAQIYAEM